MSTLAWVEIKQFLYKPEETPAGTPKKEVGKAADSPFGKARTVTPRRASVFETIEPDQEYSRNSLSAGSAEQQELVARRYLDVPGRIGERIIGRASRNRRPPHVVAAKGRTTDWRKSKLAWRMDQVKSATAVLELSALIAVIVDEHHRMVR
jgi:hypothetical protein